MDGAGKARTYRHLSAQERTLIQAQDAQGASARSIGRLLGRAASSVTRELERNAHGGPYVASQAQQAASDRRAAGRAGGRKLAPTTALWQPVCEGLRAGLSPEQVAGRLRRMNDDVAVISHETIYCALYVLPRGELRTELIGLLRRRHAKRLPRTRGKDRRGFLRDMVPIAQRPIEVAARLVPGHWEGDFIKGAANRSAVGTLVERTSRYVILAKMEGTNSAAALEGFAKRFRHVPACVRKTLTYDQGKEMALHKQLKQRARIDVYFADPHSPWQRGTNENTNGLIREYLPRGIDLAPISQGYLNAVARQLNNRPRKCLGYATPAEVYAEQIERARQPVAVQT